MKLYNKEAIESVPVKKLGIPRVENQLQFPTAENCVVDISKDFFIMFVMIKSLSDKAFQTSVPILRKNCFKDKILIRPKRQSQKAS